jgi:hypothetical protein
MEANPKDIVDDARDRCSSEYSGTLGTDVSRHRHWVIMPFIDCWDYTEKAIEDVMAQTFPSDGYTQLLLVDNGSSNEVRENLDAICPRWLGRINIWHHRPPLPSLAASWNRALDFVWATGALHAWVVNNDVKLHQGTYATLLWAMAKIRIKSAEMWSKAWFISGVGVNEDEFDYDANYGALEMDTGEGFYKGGPDFSCFVITKQCHEKYRFDEGFIPAYFDDNDYHRRMKLGGDGEHIFGVNVPFLHYGSVTIKRSPEVIAGWAKQFDVARQHYIDKWGGLPGNEKWDRPFGGGE